MSRELKFRAWNRLTQEMWDCDKLVLSAIYLGVARGGFVDVSFDERNPMPELIPMQYTGLKDKNGKEIYEGDILKYPDGDNGFVRFDWGWAIQYSNTHSHDMPQYYCDNLEIVGNIYENKESLK